MGQWSYGLMTMLMKTSPFAFYSSTQAKKSAICALRSMPLEFSTIINKYYLLICVGSDVAVDYV